MAHIKLSGDLLLVMEHQGGRVRLVITDGAHDLACRKERVAVIIKVPLIKPKPVIQRPCATA